MAQGKRLAVLGGGMASLVTVFELTSQPGWRRRWSGITVYQMGWRLGGKGASGRNAEAGQRIEEHGLHLLFGCYENTFRILDAAYREREYGPGERVWRITDAVEPHDRVLMFEPTDAGWEPWPLDLVRRDGFPGQGPPLELGVANYLDLLLRWAIDQARRLLGGFGLFSDREFVRDAEARHAASADPEVETLIRELEEARSLLQRREPADAEVVRDAAARGLGAGAIAGILELCARALARMQRLPSPSRALRHAATHLEFTVTVVKGLLSDGVLGGARENWMAIDDDDLRAWLARHGASHRVLDSAPTRALYAAVFSDGRSVAAGAILHALVRACHFKGAAIYRMNAGMGDTIFTPLYHVLRKRGVRFEFFHRVESLELSDDRRKIDRVRITRQLDLRDPAASYFPLVPVEGLACWPSTPRVSELAPHEAATVAQYDMEDWWSEWKGRDEVVLEAGRDFDRVLLGISIGAFPDVCRELIEDRTHPRFARTVSTVLARQTQCSQLWMTKDDAGIGRPQRPVVIPYAAPLDTCADMTHLLAEEGHDASVKTLVYLCSRMEDEEPVPPARSDPDYPVRQRARVFANLEAWLRKSGSGLWPGATAAGAFDWNVLHDPSGAAGAARLASQFWIACQNPSDRYVLAVPGSTKYRLRADESGYENLTLTGDWTLNDMNVGCLEGATMAGIRSARALDRKVPKPIYAWLPDAEEVDGGPGTRRIARAAARAFAPPTYIPRDGEMLVMPPVDLAVDLTSFFVPADPVRLQRLCDLELNGRGPQRYRPAGPFVVFYCSALDNIVPEGSIEEIDFGVWVPVLAGHDEAGRWVADRLLTYSPYLWVSNSAALVGGRSVFGFPKHVASLGFPRAAGDPALFSADTWVVDVQGGAAHDARLLEIERTDAPTWQARGPRWDVPAILRVVAHLFRKGALPPRPSLELIGQLLAPDSGMPMVFLKQLPAADGTSNAVYQAVLEADVPITGGGEGGAIGGNWTVRTRACWSHDIARNLGLPHRRVRRGGTSWCEMDSLAQGWMTFTARVQPAKTIWENIGPVGVR